MSLILNIDTTSTVADISIAENGNILCHKSNDCQRDHAGFIQPAISTILKQLNLSVKQLEAIAVNIGPGSYTGIRVGLASAKGLSYGLKIPLIGIDSLKLLAFSATIDETINNEGLIIPMIDARRMEVFTAVYDSTLKTILQPCSMILDNSSFSSLSDRKNFIFIGDGITKWQKICTIKTASFLHTSMTAKALSLLSYKKFIENDFMDLAYSEPFYLKEFFPISKIKSP